MTKYLKPELVDSILANVGSRMFTVEFEKKDGTLRTMNARMGVKKHLKGGDKTTAHIPELVTVWDQTKRQYRCINKTSVVAIRAEGMEVAVK